MFTFFNMGNKKESSKSDDVLQEIDSLEMSRGEKEVVPVNFNKIRDLVIYDEAGEEVKFGSIFKDKKTIIVFTRHFLDFISKDYVEDLACIPEDKLEAASVQLVTIGPAPYKFIKYFREKTGYKHKMYTDPDRVLYKALGMSDQLASGNMNYSKHIKQGSFMGVVRMTWEAMKMQAYMGDVKQQGGSFILGPGEVTHFSHCDKSSTDHSNINTLLEFAGVEPVSFPKDKRVEHV